MNFTKKKMLNKDGSPRIVQASDISKVLPHKDAKKSVAVLNSGKECTADVPVAALEAWAKMKSTDVWRSKFSQPKAQRD